MTPPAAAHDFVRNAGWTNFEILPLAGDASFRRYFRVVAPNRSAVLMDAPAPHEDPRPFLTVAEHLIALGFSAPRTLAADLEHGLVLLEDFGDARMREVIDAAPEAELRIYSDAVDLLVRLHKHRAADLPPYDEREYLREACLLPEWYAPALGLAVDNAGYRAAWGEALAPLLTDHSVTVLRDYHAENIMLIEGRDGIEGLGLLDFQDALAGHPAYDLVSLLQDARRDVAEALEADMLNRYLEEAGPGPGFTDTYWLLG
ncbi:MAG TPA: phosphotransferase, partial [Sphingomonas sp.]|nr:phosphotransferase [Sphingomonas sp.]